MIDFMRRLYHGSALGRFLLGFARRGYQAYKRWRLSARSDASVIKWAFKQQLHYAPDLKNPKTLNEKIQWLKLHDRTPLHTQCADKYAVREYVASKVSAKHLVPLLYHTENVADVTPERLPAAPFIVKTNHASFGGTVVRDKTAIDWKQLREELAKQMAVNWYNRTREWPYKDIKPCVVVERLLLDAGGNLPSDYKIHCLHGEPKVIQVDLDRFTDHKRNLYDPQWRLLPFTWCSWGGGKPLWPNGGDVPRPRQLPIMLDLAGRLSSDFLYARIDMYALDDDQTFFGEITFHHGSGYETFTPAEWDRKLGDMLRLPDESRNRLCAQ